MIENKIERITNATVKNYIHDGYKLLDYEFDVIYSKLRNFIKLVI